MNTSTSTSAGTWVNTSTSASAPATRRASSPDTHDCRTSFRGVSSAAEKPEDCRCAFRDKRFDPGPLETPHETCSASARGRERSHDTTLEARGAGTSEGNESAASGEGSTRSASGSARESGTGTRESYRRSMP